MFGFIKNLLRKSSTASAGEYAADTEVAPEPPPAPESYVPPVQSPPPNFRRAAPANRAPGAGNGKGIEVPLQKILEGFPLELQPRIRQSDVSDYSITIPLEKVLAQLSRGVVKVSFGELRLAAPEVFSAENDRDRVLVPLPLNEVLSRLNPALITRRRVQRQVEVPAEISSPFDPEGNGTSFTYNSGRRVEPAQSAPVRAITPPPPHAAPSRAIAPSRGNGSAHAPVAPQSTPLTANRHSISSVPTPPPPAAPHPRPPVAMPPVAHHPQPPVAVPPPEIDEPPVSAPATIPMPRLSLDPKPRELPRPSAPAVPATSPAKPAAGGEPLLVSLAALAEAWPEVVRKEIVDLKLVEAKVALPLQPVEQALKQGRISFSWKSLRSWIKPAILPAVSAHDGLVLELPLKVVAPLFLARQQEASKTHQKVAVDEDIPNLFFGFPQPENGVPVAAATAKPADTNFYVWDDSNDMVRVHESETKRGPTPGTKFVAKYATPNEVVSRAAGLDGVVGVLIALPDGLMVANRLPPEVNADTLAAFLPQIFGKVSQTTKELRMGELNNLNFTVGNVPWKIFRVNAIFFAAFGRPGEPLPTAQLAALAAELDHKPKS
jgi:predicted regulator of Ras-like GTPase activity (Roadblock/LC7/MglB family)